MEIEQHCFFFEILMLKIPLKTAVLIQKTDLVIIIIVISYYEISMKITIDQQTKRIIINKRGHEIHTRLKQKRPFPTKNNRIEQQLPHNR